MSRIFIRNIPIKIKEAELEDLFSKAGKIINIVLKTNFAFIQYDSERDANESLRLFHDYNIFGNKLVVEIAKSRTEKLAERMNEKCFKCSEFGHWAKDCKAAKREKRAERRKFKRIRKSPKRSFSRSFSESSRSRSRSRDR